MNDSHDGKRAKDRQAGQRRLRLPFVLSFSEYSFWVLLPDCVKSIGEYAINVERNLSKTQQKTQNKTENSLQMIA